MRDASPRTFPVLLITAERERLWETTISQRSPWGGVRNCLRQPRPIFVDKEDRPKPGAYWMCRPCLTSALHEGGALARIIVHTMQGNRGSSFASPTPPSLCEAPLMKNPVKQHMLGPRCAGTSYQRTVRFEG